MPINYSQTLIGGRELKTVLSTGQRTRFGNILSRIQASSVGGRQSEQTRATSELQSFMAALTSQQRGGIELTTAGKPVPFPGGGGYTTGAPSKLDIQRFISGITPAKSIEEEGVIPLEEIKKINPGRRIPVQPQPTQSKPISQISKEDYQLKQGETIPEYNKRIAKLRGETLPQAQEPTAISRKDYQLKSGETHPDYYARIAKLRGEQPQAGQADPQQQINQIDDDANKDQQKEFDIIDTEVGDVDTSDSAKLIENLTKTLEDEKEKEEEQPSLEEQFEAKRKELDIEPLETELSDIDAEIDKIQTNLLVEAEKAGERLVPMGQITRRRGKLQQEAQQRIALLNVERSAIARQLSNKMDTLKMVMDFTQTDYENASQKYNEQYDRNIQLINILRSEEEKEKQEENRVRDDARANLKIVQDNIKDGNIDFADLTESQLLNISKLELSAELPLGITSFINQNIEGKELWKGARTDESGNKWLDVVVQDTDGTTRVDNVFLGGAKGGDGGGGYINNDTGEELTPIEAGRLMIENNPDISDETMRLNLSNEIEELSVTDINNLVKERQVETQKEFKPITPEEAKTKIVEILEPLKDTYKRDEARTAAENQLKSALELSTKQELPEAFKDAIEDALVEVYGRTFWQKVIPFGR